MRKRFWRRLAGCIATSAQGSLSDRGRQRAQASMVTPCSFALPLRCAPSCLSAAPPNIMLWSWFASDDLRFLKDADVGVAWRALSLRFEGRTQVIPEPRFVPIRLSRDTWQMIVIRCDSDTYSPERRPAFSPQQRHLAARMIAEIAAVTARQAVQIDFDAPQSAYPFYRQLLADVRGKLGPTVFLSVTALVSWCQSAQSWLAGAPVDEIVPMAFSMGQATPAVVTLLRRGAQFALPAAGAASGSSSGAMTRSSRENRQRAYFFPRGNLGAPRWCRRRAARLCHETQSRAR